MVGDERSQSCSSLMQAHRQNNEFSIQDDEAAIVLCPRSTNGCVRSRQRKWPMKKPRRRWSESWSMMMVTRSYCWSRRLASTLMRPIDMGWLSDAVDGTSQTNPLIINPSDQVAHWDPDDEDRFIISCSASRVSDGSLKHEEKMDEQGRCVTTTMQVNFPNVANPIVHSNSNEVGLLAVTRNQSESGWWIEANGVRLSVSLVPGFDKAPDINDVNEMITTNFKKIVDLIKNVQQCHDMMLCIE